MAPAAEAFARHVDQAGLAQAALPVVGNVGAQALRSAGELGDDVKQQLTARVRWTESVRRMTADGIQTFAEIGTGDVLIGLIRRIDRAPALVALDAPASLDAFLA
jgi:[acyl-carrier-protein] S-malonyltransferase